MLVRVHASSVNPAEWYTRERPVVREAVRNRQSPGPRILGVGSDLAGRVEAVGTDVTEFQPGDEVFGTGRAAWAEYAAARRSGWFRSPPTCPSRKRQPCPIAALTALQALRDHGQPTTRPEGADQRRLRRRRHVRRPDRQGPRRRRDGRMLPAERRAGARRSAPTASSTTRRSFTKLDIRHDLLIDIAGSKPSREAHARPDAGGDGRDPRGEVSGPTGSGLSGT